jgi:hypothetical protein
MSELSTFAQGEPHRFRMIGDWFVATRTQGLHSVRIGATAERSVDLLHALTAHLDSEVDIRMADVRSGRVWEGALLALHAVRDVVGRLRMPLASYGGVELTVFTAEDQLTITPELLLVIYARTDRWSFLLDGMGLIERQELPQADWVPSRETLRPQEELEFALNAAAERIGLREVTA